MADNVYSLSPYNLQAFEEILRSLRLCSYALDVLSRVDNDICVEWLELNREFVSRLEQCKFDFCVLHKCLLEGSNMNSDF